MGDADKDLNVLSIFSGCGGMDLGFEGGYDVLDDCVNGDVHPSWSASPKRPGWSVVPSTRFKTVFANDILRAGRAAWVPYFTARGADASAYHLESVVDLVKRARDGSFQFPKVDVVTGGFPCQDFSLAGKRGGFSSHKGHHGSVLSDIDDPSDENRGKLYMWMRHVIELAAPKVFVAENVRGLASLSDVKQVIENDFRSVGSGYIVVDAKILKAAEYGVPQTRERVIFIGLRRDALTDEAIQRLTAAGQLDAAFDPYPPRTHGPGLKPRVAVGRCLADLPEPDQSDDRSQQARSKAKWYGKHCQGNREIDPRKPAPTIRAEHHGNIEFRRLSVEHGGVCEEELSRGLGERRLTVRECARIQTFPDDYEFVRPAKERGKEFKLSGSEGYKVIGNAVPPLLASHIAWRLQALWPKIMKD